AAAGSAGWRRCSPGGLSATAGPGPSATVAGYPRGRAPAHPKPALSGKHRHRSPTCGAADAAVLQPPQHAGLLRGRRRRPGGLRRRLRAQRQRLGHARRARRGVRGRRRRCRLGGLGGRPDPGPAQRVVPLAAAGGPLPPARPGDGGAVEPAGAAGAGRPLMSSAAVLWTDVGPRDGLQNLAEPAPTEVKVRLVRGLPAAGLPRVEATSFVSPKWVPQLADAAEVLAGVGTDALPRLRVLIPNLRGLELALEHGVGNVLVTVGATESFNRRNVNRSVAESLAGVGDIVGRARPAGVTVDVAL